MPLDTIGVCYGARLPAATREKVLDYMQAAERGSVGLRLHGQSRACSRCRRNQAVRIPREFEFSGEDVITRKEGDRFILEPAPPRLLLSLFYDSDRPASPFQQGRDIDVDTRKHE